MVDSRVGIAKVDEIRYPANALYDPEKIHPEYPFKPGFIGSDNGVYEGVRKLLSVMGMDSGNFGTADWNPLKDIVKKGDVVFIKPNMIRQSHISKDEWECVITHGSIIRAVIDYVVIALQGEGTVLIGDGPQTDSDFEEICEKLRLPELMRFYNSRIKGISFSLVDLREEKWIAENGIIVKKIPLSGPEQSVTIELGEKSEFFGQHAKKQYYGAYYDVQDTNAHHCGGTHTYMLSKNVLRADVIINLPKLKTHKKTGITVALKNMVGVTRHRNWLPHYCIGDPKAGGDERRRMGWLQSLESLLMQRLRLILKFAGKSNALISKFTRIGEFVFGSRKNTVRSGNWYGNDTIWRTVLDINKALFYFDEHGRTQNNKRTKYFTLVDGIISGEGQGPMEPDPVSTGVLIGGYNPVAVDCVCAKLMGFDYKKIPTLSKAFEIRSYPLIAHKYSDIEVSSDKTEWNGALKDLKKDDMFNFKPHFGWKGHIEL